MSYAIRVLDLKKQFVVKSKGEGFYSGLKSLFAPKYKSVVAVNSISFNIREGELVGFIGPNGAGKSTTLKMLSGILFPSSGSIEVLGHIPSKERVKLAYKIGAIFGQKQQLLYHLPPVDSFYLFSKIYEVSKKDYELRLRELVKLFEIEPYLHTPVRKLSLGERMRCEFVAALLHKPKVLFLDEPTIGMDLIAKKKLREYIRRLNEHEKTTIILTSHDLDDIEELCQRVILINKGRILYDGSMEKIKKKLKYKVLELYLDKEVKMLPNIPHAVVLEHSAFKVRIRFDRTKVQIRKILDTYLENCKVADIVVEEPPIEEVIERLYRK